MKIVNYQRLQDTSENNMATAIFCDIDAFDLSDDCAKTLWEEWCERLDQFFIVNGLDKTNGTDKDKCRAIFLSRVGSKTYSLIRTLCHWDKPHDKTLDALQKLVKDHLSPEPIVIAERFVFLNRRQTTGETAAEFLNSLRKLAETCDFGTFRDQALRDMFVIGMNDHDTQQRLLGEKNLTLEKAFNQAQNAERTKKHVSDISGEVHKLQVSGKYHKSSAQSGNRSSKAVSRACFTCGEEGHFKAECPQRADKAKNQKRPKHKYKKRHVHKVDPGSSGPSESDDEAEFNGQLHAIRIGKLGDDEKNVPQFMVQVQVNDRPLNMEIDTGASFSIIPFKQYEKYKLGELEPTDLTLYTVTGDKVKVFGKCKVTVKYHEKSYELYLYVTGSEGPALLGRNWLAEIPLDWGFLKSLKEGRITDGLLQRYSSLFDGQLGKVEGIKAKLEMKPDARPRFHKPRTVPYALREQIEEEIKRLVSVGILKKIDYSDYAAPIVPVKKASGGLRICGDYSVTINKHLRIPEHPMPSIEELLVKLNGGEKFSKLDLSQAYQQVELDNESQSLVAINTHLGLYTYTRCPYGISAAPSLFQSVMDRVLEGLNCGCYLDDIVVTGKDDAEHMENLSKVMARLAKYGFKLQRSKCEFLKPDIHYLGHVISKDGVQKDESATEAIREAPAPRDKPELRSFMGLVNQYRKFVGNLSTTASPLNELLQDGARYKWTAVRSGAFGEIKQKLLKDTVLAHYDPSKEIYLAVDASPVGLGAVITHGKGKEERPIAFASRTLTEAERNYSQIDREALAIIYGIKKFHYYLYGRKFTLYSDNQPLCHILGSRKGLPSIAASRVLRWAVELAMYNFEVQHRPGKKNCCADALSRLPLPTVEESPAVIKWTQEATECNLRAVRSLPVTSAQISKATLTDVQLSRVLHYVRTGWPGEVSAELQCYWQKKMEISVEEGCLLWGTRVLIPDKLRSTLLDELHEGHQGIVKMKSLARLHFWWPNLDKEIEDVVRKCGECQHAQPAPAQIAHNAWAWPDKPWKRVHIDFAQYEGDYYFVMVDAHSKWPEAIMMPKGTNAERTIEAMRSVFSRNGLCEELVADNGPPFPSKDVQEFLQDNGIKSIFSAPYHPSSNGEAERFVRTLKHGLKKNKGKVSKLHRLHEFLLVYRSTPHSTTGQPPSELMFGRRIRTRLDLVHPDRRDKICRKSKGVQNPRLLSIGERVLARDYRNIRKPGWLGGVIIERLSPVTYHVQVELRGELVVWKRHIDQIRHTEVDLDLAGKNESEKLHQNFDYVPSCVVGLQPPPATQNITQEDNGGRAPDGQPSPEVIAPSAAAGASVVDPSSQQQDVPAATAAQQRDHPRRTRRFPSTHYKDFDMTR